MSPTKTENLATALAQLGIELPADQIAQLDQYCRRLWDWNQRLNLTRHTDFETFVGRDVLDSLHLSALLHSGEEVLDVGTGGGVPGIVLAIIRPDLQVTLCESVGKKAAVVKQIVSELNLSTPVFACRAEHLLEDCRFDTLVARAVGPLWKMCRWFQPHWTSIGRLLAIKGPRWVEERQEARHRGLLKNLELRCVDRYTIPGTGAESVILQIWPKGAKEPSTARFDPGRSCR